MNLQFTGTPFTVSDVFSWRFRRKSTTLTVASFFRQFNAFGPLFCSFVQLLGREVNPDFLGSEKQESVGSSLALNHKFFMLPKVDQRVPLCGFFSALCDIFPKIFEFYQTVPP